MSYFSTPELRAERRERSKARRKAEQSRRAEVRARNILLYRGPVALTPEITAVIRAGKPVKAAMSGRWMHRATIIRALRLFDGPSPLNIETRQANVILLADDRADLTGWVLAEIIDIGSDIRVHISRLKELRGASGRANDAPLLQFVAPRSERGQIMPPLMPPDQPAWKDSTE